MNSPYCIEVSNMVFLKHDKLIFNADIKTDGDHKQIDGFGNVCEFRSRTVNGKKYVICDYLPKKGERVFFSNYSVDKLKNSDAKNAGYILQKSMKFDNGVRFETSDWRVDV